jgi:hypothetical protein
MAGKLKVMAAVLSVHVLLGCGGMAHIDLPPRVIVSPSGGDASKEPPGQDPTRPLNLPDTRF